MYGDKRRSSLRRTHGNSNVTFRPGSRRRGTAENCSFVSAGFARLNICFCFQTGPAVGSQAPVVTVWFMIDDGTMTTHRRPRASRSRNFCTPGAPLPDDRIVLPTDLTASTSPFLLIPRPRGRLCPPFSNWLSHHLHSRPTDYRALLPVISLNFG